MSLPVSLNLLSVWLAKVRHQTPPPVLKEQEDNPPMASANLSSSSTASLSPLDSELRACDSWEFTRHCSQSGQDACKVYVAAVGKYKT